MNPHDDLPPKDLSRLRSALEQRATGDSPTQPAALLVSAQRRATSLHRRVVAGGTLAALLFAGALAGALIANHGRATVGVSVAGGTTTDAPTTSWTGPTTTVGPAGLNLAVTCGASFFSPATWTSLEDHFGPKLDCGRVGNTWLVSFRGNAVTAALLRCNASDAACLDASTVHDFSSFKAVFLPHVSATSAGATWSTISTAGVIDSTVELTWLPAVPPTPTPVSSLRISGSPADFTIEYGVTCEPSDGPSTTDWAGKPMDVMSGQQALAALVPDWRTSPPMNPC